jgi:hypothetical protein
MNQKEAMDNAVKNLKEAVRIWTQTEYPKIQNVKIG